MKGGSFDALMAFFTHDDKFIVDSAMVELIAVKLAVSHAKFYVKTHHEHFNKPLLVIIDNTSMWSNRFAGGSAPPLKPPLRKMMDVVLANICGALTQAMFGGQVCCYTRARTDCQTRGVLISWQGWLLEGKSKPGIQLMLLLTLTHASW